MSEGRGRSRLVQRYLNLLEASLTGMQFEDKPFDLWSGDTFDEQAPARAGLALAFLFHDRQRPDAKSALRLRDRGAGWGRGRLHRDGFWRGGACILMRGILEAYGDDKRRVFVADSFAGLPSPDPQNFPADAGDRHHTYTQLQVSRADVENNFRRFGLLDERVVFLEGWFKDTLPAAPVDQLAVLRLDGDMYESTIEAMDALYHKVSYGGFVIVDDYILATCAQAVHDFRNSHGITSPILPIDGMGTYWRVDHQPIGRSSR